MITTITRTATAMTMIMVTNTIILLPEAMPARGGWSRRSQSSVLSR